MRVLHWLLLLCVSAWAPLAQAQAPGKESRVLDALEEAAAGSGADVDAEILDEAATAGADIEKLKAETKVLETIGQGVTLSLAQCAGVENCEPPVNRAELERLAATVEQRINGLVPRQSETGVEDLLIAYASIRDTYSSQLGKLGEIAPEAEPAAETDTFGSETPAEGATESAAAPAASSEFSIFEDVDESLTDEPAEDEGAEPEAPQ